MISFTGWNRWLLCFIEWDDTITSKDEERVSFMSSPIVVCDVRLASWLSIVLAMEAWHLWELAMVVFGCRRTQQLLMDTFPILLIAIWKHIVYILYCTVCAVCAEISAVHTVYSAPWEPRGMQSKSGLKPPPHIAFSRFSGHTRASESKVCASVSLYYKYIPLFCF